MSLKIITGRAGTGKSHLLMNDMVKKSAENPMGEPLIFLVPEQASFNTEWELLNSFGIEGSFRIKVCGFRKLFEIIGAEQGLTVKPWLNDLGKSMILRRLVSKHQDSFGVFAKAAKHKGFVENLRLIIDELEKYGITQSALSSAGKYFGTSGINPTISEKIADISMIYGEYSEIINDNYCDETRLLYILAEALGKSEIIKNSEIYIDCYTDFDPAQIAVLKELIKNAKSVNIALICDNHFGCDNESVFAFSERTFCWLKQFAEDENIESEHIHLNYNYRHCENEEMLISEKAFAKKYFSPVDKKTENNSVFVVSAENTEKQIEYIAFNILKKVRDCNYRMSDFAVISRNLAESNEIIRKVLDKFQIPHFTDVSKNMSQHPLIETVLSLLEVISEKWQSAAVMRFLKTGLSAVENEDLWHLENYALANGIKGSYWKKAGTWERFYVNNHNLIKSADVEEAAAAKTALAEINSIGKQALAPLHRFEKELCDIVKTKGKYLLRDVIRLIEDFLDYINAEEILESWAVNAVETKESDKSAYHKQVYPLFKDLLRQLRDFLGDTYVTLSEVYELIAEGSDKMDLTIIPSAVDTVMVSDISRSRIYNVKCAFVIDCNEGVFPMRIGEEGLLSTKDRDDLRSVGLNLAVSQKELQFAEDYQAYMALTRANTELYLLKSEFDTSGNRMKPSVIIDNIKTVLPNISTAVYNEQVTEKELFNNRAILEMAEKNISDYNNKKNDSFWLQVVKYFKEENIFNRELSFAASGFEYQKEEGLLSAEIVNKLYGKMTSTSVSKIETYNRCPCMYFGKYGLKLANREEFKIDSKNVGLVYHEIMANVLQKIIEQNIDFADINAETVRPLVISALDSYDIQGTGNMFEQSEKNKYMRDKIVYVALNGLLDIAYHLSLGDFRPVEFEVSFGWGMDIKAVEFRLSNGNIVRLNGIIDRVDMAETDTDTYYRIIDYKSSDKELELSDIYYGLNWQMPVYLNALLSSKANLKKKSEKNVKPAGMFYFSIRELVESVESGQTETEGKIRKMKGLAILDGKAVELAERDIYSNLKSKSMNLSIKKDGEFSKSSKGFEAVDFPVIQKYINMMITDNLERMAGGWVNQHPVKNNGTVSCEYCDFKNICLLDNSIKEDVRVLRKLNSADVLTKIKEYVYKNENRV